MAEEPSKMLYIISITGYRNLKEYLTKGKIQNWFSFGNSEAVFMNYQAGDKFI